MYISINTMWNDSLIRMPTIKNNMSYHGIVIIVHPAIKNFETGELFKEAFRACEFSTGYSLFKRSNKNAESIKEAFDIAIHNINEYGIEKTLNRIKKLDKVN